ncbi:putative secreted protein [Corynebacterium renale]|nr:putative secreted protein [Corynebacterium renale]STC95435.1 putative secreted protein [Corynebacterium renale]
MERGPYGMSFVQWILVAIIVIVAALAAWRFFFVRSAGTSVVMRMLPADDGRHWRHGTIVYKGDVLHFFKLRSLGPLADAAFNRQNISLTGRRHATDREASVLEPVNGIVSFTVGDVEWELSADLRTEMAFTAWVEAAPDVRQQRPDFHRLRDRVSRSRRR